MKKYTWWIVAAVLLAVGVYFFRGNTMTASADLPDLVRSGFREKLGREPSAKEVNDWTAYLVDRQKAKGSLTAAVADFRKVLSEHPEWR